MNSQPCADDSECAATQRCRQGACGPICFDDSECGASQVCLADGTCGARPECAKDTDCAVGFTCNQGRCECEDDSACAANQQCTNGRCEARERCTSDDDCAGTGNRCEVTSGTCVPVCNWPTDCAPGIDSRLAFALWNCDEGTCKRRCTADLQCGATSLICLGGTCEAAQCTTFADCPTGRYCSSATFGRCLTLTACTDASQCGINYECRAFSQLECPPGFDCATKLCLELPLCIADQDCVSLSDAGVTPTGYCEQGHCQRSTGCTINAQCTSPDICIGGVCVPGICREHADCDGGYCVAGACTPEITMPEVSSLVLSPTSAIVLEGDTLQLTLRGLRFSGTGTPLSLAVYEVLDADGGVSSLATVSDAGVLTAISAGDVKLRAQLAGNTARSNLASVHIVPALMMGRRVIVTDAATGQPLPGALVRACQGDCSTPTDVVAGADGIAAFPLLDNQPASFTVVPVDVRSDGLPAHERATLLSTTVADVALPLRENPVHGAAGFNGSVGFNHVSSSGNVWAGFIAVSMSDVASMTPSRLLGDNFMTEIPGVGQSIPVPGAVVIYTSPGLGIPQDVKTKALGFAQPGVARFAQAWAGRTSTSLLTSIRSIDLLSYLSAFDFQQQAGLDFSSWAYVPDVTDVDGDGQCTSTTTCPSGTEDVPDYGHFTTTPFLPDAPQRLRTEVVVQPIPSAFDTVLVASALFDARAGVLPTGFASKTANPAGDNGLREVGTVVVHGGQASNGTEVAQPGIWAIAMNNAGTSSSARLSNPAHLDTKVLLRPFLPAPADPSWDVGTRTFHPGSTWSSIYANGGEVGRVSLTGSETRHVLYFPMANGQTEVVWPGVPPGGPGQEPTAQGQVTIELVALDLVSNVALDALFDARGVTLANPSSIIDGYSRLDR